MRVNRKLIVKVFLCYLRESFRVLECEKFFATSASAPIKPCLVIEGCSLGSLYASCRNDLKE